MAIQQREVEIDAGASVSLAGDLSLPASPAALVVFAHGTGSGRLSPRNRQVAGRLNEAGLGTLLLDLLTVAEEDDRRKVFDIGLLAERLAVATAWTRSREDLSALPVEYFGASTGAAAALQAAAGLDDPVAAIVSRGGRPDLAGEALDTVTAPTLLIVGGADTEVLSLNEDAHERLRHSELTVVPGAGHLFEEPGALERVGELAADWLSRNASA